MRSAFPRWMRISWLLLAPIGSIFAVRIAWEKTVWTWTRGPQMVGFSLMHIHPLFGIVGIICSLLLMLWLIPALIYAILRRDVCSKADVAMLALSLLVTAAIILPDTLFAHSK